MPPASALPAGSPPRAATPGEEHDFNGPEDLATAAVWRRRYLVLQEAMDSQSPAKRKEK